MSGIWYHKYRPQTLDDYVWKNPQLRQDIENWVSNPTALRNLVLAGPYGTGKTSLALMMQDLLGLDSGDFLFINASLNRGIDMIRQDIVSHCENAGWGGIKVVVLDEAERLTESAQESLKGVMDTYGEYTRFIFTTNRLSRISGGLKSRSRIVIVDQIDELAFSNRIVQIAQSEGVFDEDSSMEEVEAIQGIIDKTYPDMRKAIELLQDSVHDGKVCSPSDEESMSAGWVDFIVDTLTGNGTLDGTRQYLAGIRTEEMEDIYRFLYEHVEEYCNDPHMAVVTVAEYLDRHSRSTFPDITLAALLIKLQES